MTKILPLMLLGVLVVLSTRADATHFEIYGGRSVEELAALRDLGFEQVVLERFDLAIDAERLGFSLVLPNWWSTDTSWELISARLDEARRVTRLASINMMDEPDFNGVESHPPVLYQGIREHIQQTGFQGPLSLTIYGPKNSWPPDAIDRFRGYLRAIDILRIDPYPVIAGAPLSLVHQWTVRARKLMCETLGHELPLVVILQTWSEEDGADGIPKLPSIAQLRVMAYQGLLLRVETLSFFDYNLTVWTKVPRFVEGFRDLMRELRSLRDRLEASQVTTSMDADVLTATIQPGSVKPQVIQVNTSDRVVGDLEPYEVRYAR